MASKGTGLGHMHYKMMSRCYRPQDVMYKDYGANVSNGANSSVQ